MAKTGRQMDRASERLQERLHAGIAEPQGGHAMVFEPQRLLQSVQGVGRESALMTDAFHGQEGVIHLIANSAQGREAIEPLREAKVVGIIDGQFRA